MAKDGGTAVGDGVLSFTYILLIGFSSYSQCIDEAARRPLRLGAILSTHELSREREMC